MERHEILRRVKEIERLAKGVESEASPDIASLMGDVRLQCFEARWLLGDAVDLLPDWEATETQDEEARQ